jgi:alkylation response protein AidB-like acyl-CoA dehydrogenase
MDFDLSEEQQAVCDLAEQIFTGQLTAERFKALTDGWDPALWSELAKAGLLGVSVPSGFGGAGEGFLATALLLEQAGKHAAPVPLLATLVLGALPVAQFGTPSQQETLLPGVVDGSLILTAALIEPGADAAHPGTRARREGDGWVLDGSKTCVPAGTIAGQALVPAATDGGVAVFIVDLSGAGVTTTPLQATTGSPMARIELAAAPATLLGDGSVPGAEIVEWIVEHATSAMCSQMAGAAKKTVALTAEYAKSRQQFDRPIATFQAVGQRAADAYIDAEAIHLTSRQAAWRLGEGLPSTAQVAIAKFWAADAGQRVVHAGAHIHGGVGVDRDYPLHRYFLLAKEIELTLGGATQNLLKLGAILAEEPASV